MKKKVLIVDDQSNVRQILEFNLKRKGLEVLSASDGLTALTLLTKEKPDLLLLDIMMPGLDGFQILEKLRAMPSLACQTLVISAKGTQEDIVRARTLGAKDYIVKPFNLEMVFQKVFRILDSAPSKEEAVPAAAASAPRISPEGAALLRLSRTPSEGEAQIGDALERFAAAGLSRVLVDCAGVEEAEAIFFAKLAKMGQDHRIGIHLHLPQESLRRTLTEANLAKHFVVHEEAASALRGASAANGA